MSYRPATSAMAPKVALGTTTNRVRRPASSSSSSSSTISGRVTPTTTTTATTQNGHRSPTGTTSSIVNDSKRNLITRNGTVGHTHSLSSSSLTPPNDVRNNGKESKTPSLTPPSNNHTSSGNGIGTMNTRTASNNNSGSMSARNLTSSGSLRGINGSKVMINGRTPTSAATNVTASAATLIRRKRMGRNKEDIVPMSSTPPPRTLLQSLTKRLSDLTFLQSLPVSVLSLISEYVIVNQYAILFRKSGELILDGNNILSSWQPLLHLPTMNPEPQYTHHSRVVYDCNTNTVYQVRYNAPDGYYYSNIDTITPIADLWACNVLDLIHHHQQLQEEQDRANTKVAVAASALPSTASSRGVVDTKERKLELKHVHQWNKVGVAPHPSCSLSNNQLVWINGTSTSNSNSSNGDHCSSYLLSMAQIGVRTVATADNNYSTFHKESSYILAPLISTPPFNYSYLSSSSVSSSFSTSRPLISLKWSLITRALFTDTTPTTTIAGSSNNKKDNRNKYLQTLTEAAAIAKRQSDEESHVIPNMLVVFDGSLYAWYNTNRSGSFPPRCFTPSPSLLSSPPPLPVSSGVRVPTTIVTPTGIGGVTEEKNTHTPIHDSTLSTECSIPLAPQITNTTKTDERMMMKCNKENGWRRIKSPPPVAPPLEDGNYLLQWKYTCSIPSIGILLFSSLSVSSQVHQVGQEIVCAYDPPTDSYRLLRWSIPITPQSDYRDDALQVFYCNGSLIMMADEMVRKGDNPNIDVAVPVDYITLFVFFFP
jgi:hypothetical protein